MTLRVTNDTTVECGNSIGLFVEKEYQEGETLKYKWIPSTGLDNDSIAFPGLVAPQQKTHLHSHCYIIKLAVLHQQMLLSTCFRCINLRLELLE